MKKLLALLFIVAAISVSAQKKDSVQLTDTTKFLSIADINRFAQKYQDMATFKEYQSFINIMNAIIKDAIVEWNTKKKKQ